MDFDLSYSPVVHADSFRIKTDILDMHRLNARILYVSIAFQNKTVFIHERVCVSPPPYYIYWFEISCPNIPLNWDEGPFCFQCMDIIQGRKPDGKQWNRLLDAVITIIKYKKITIDNDICIKLLPDATVHYIAFLMILF